MSANFNDEVYEDKRAFETESRKPIGYSYPCIILETDESNPIPKSRLQTLKSMLNVSSGLDTSVEPINLYIKTDSKTLILGKLTGRQVKAFLRLFKDSNVSGYLNKNKKLDGDMLYVLST